MKRNVNLVTSISKEDRTKIVKTLFKVKLQVLAIKLAALLKRNFPYTFFRGISRVTILSCSRKQQVLQNYIPKILYQRPRKDLRIKRRHLPVLFRICALKKTANVQEKMSMLESFFRNVKLCLFKAGFYYGRFLKNASTFFGTANRQYSSDYL